MAALLAEFMAALAASARSASEMHDLQRTGAPFLAHAPASIRLLNLLWSSSAQFAQHAMSGHNFICEPWTPAANTTLEGVQLREQSRCEKEYPPRETILHRERQYSTASPTPGRT
jgi:hypothetical protein